MNYEPNMNPPYVVMCFTPEEALEVAQALKIAKVVKSQRILKPLNPPPLTLGILADAFLEAGISEAALVKS